MKVLTELPKRPKTMEGIPPHIALHHLMSVRDLHIPSLEGCRMHETVDLMIRQNYRYLDPTKATTWSTVSGDHALITPRRAPAFGAAGVGHSGTGKTDTIDRCLRSYPQVIPHETFPRLVGGHLQVNWLSVSVPGSGRSVDLATDLMREWERVTGSNRFGSELAKEMLARALTDRHNTLGAVVGPELIFWDAYEMLFFREEESQEAVFDALYRAMKCSGARCSRGSFDLLISAGTKYKHALFQMGLSSEKILELTSRCWALHPLIYR